MRPSRTRRRTRAGRPPGWPAPAPGRFGSGSRRASSRIRRGFRRPRPARRWTSGRSAPPPHRSAGPGPGRRGWRGWRNRVGLERHGRQGSGDRCSTRRWQRSQRASRARHMPAREWRRFRWCRSRWTAVGARRLRPTQRPVAGSRASTTTATPPQYSGHCSTGMARVLAAVARGRTAPRRWWRPRSTRRRPAGRGRGGTAAATSRSPSAPSATAQPTVGHRRCPSRPERVLLRRRQIAHGAVDAAPDHRVGVLAEHPGGDQPDGRGQDRRRASRRGRPAAATRTEPVGRSSTPPGTRGSTGRPGRDDPTVRPRRPQAARRGRAASRVRRPGRPAGRPWSARRPACRRRSP